MFSEKKKTTEKPYYAGLTSDELASVTGGADDWGIDEPGGGEIDWDKAGSIASDKETPNSKPFRGGFTRIK